MAMIRLAAERDRYRERGSSGFDGPALKVEHGHHEADPVVHGLGEKGKVVRSLRDDLTDNLAVFEAQLRLVLAGDGLHLGVLGEAAHEQELDAAVACRANDASHQLGADCPRCRRAS